jgi:hypothetical protein
MSPNLGSRWATWGTVSSGFREIEIGWDRLESVGHVAPFVALAKTTFLDAGAALSAAVRQLLPKLARFPFGRNLLALNVAPCGSARTVNRIV